MLPQRICKFELCGACCVLHMCNRLIIIPGKHSKFTVLLHPSLACLLSLSFHLFIFHILSIYHLFSILKTCCEDCSLPHAHCSTFPHSLGRSCLITYQSPFSKFQHTILFFCWELGVDVVTMCDSMLHKFFCCSIHSMQTPFIVTSPPYYLTSFPNYQL